ncbi:hypothetical protein ACFL5A_02635 [Gemmatimonadota bacterium]
MKPDVGRLWRNLSPLIPYGFNGALVKRSWRTPNAVTAELCTQNLTGADMTFVETGGRHFLSITPNQFATSVSRSPEETAVGIAWAGLKSADGEREEISFELGCFGLSYLTSLQLLGVGYSVEVDGLQYTSKWFVRTGAAGDYPFARGRTAFRTPDSSKTLNISWRDPTWVPVLSGFLSGASAG